MTTIIKKEPEAKKEITINKPTISGLAHNQEFLKKAQDVLGTGTQQFMSSVLTLANR